MDDGGFSGDAGGFGDSNAGADYNSFSGADNGKSSDNPFGGENIELQPSRDSTDFHDNHWGRSDSKDDDRISGGDILTVLGPGEDKSGLNGDAVMSPMMVDEKDSGLAYGHDESSDRNGCEDCFWTTVVCCDCTIL